MLFKLSLKNMKKSIKDYGIYFLTLVLGVAIFYMFNSIDGTQAMLKLSTSKQQIINLMIEMLGYVSVFIAVILGLLIVYANNFLINRPKKEFGIYMTLGMGKRQISKIILMETIFVGVISLIVGLVIGIFASQFMSIIVAKIFEADMSEFVFVFSKSACIKTFIYFTIMYLAVLLFNTFAISRYKLINLLNSNKKNEKISIKNPFLAILIFLIAINILKTAYLKVSTPSSVANSAKELLIPILMGIFGTVAVFWSLAGFILIIVQSIKKIYLKGTNIFILRQLNNKINTNVISISIICLMLFVTITILSSSLALKNTMQKDLIKMTPVDINLVKKANLGDSYEEYGELIQTTLEQREDSKVSIQETLQNNKVDINILKDIVEIPIYEIHDLTLEKFLGNKFKEIDAKYPHLIYSNPEKIIKISDYNKIARVYGMEEYSLKNDEYILICNFKNMADIRNKILENNNPIEIAGNIYKSKYKKCKDGYIEMSGSHTNTGIIVVPDETKLTEDIKAEKLLVANYNANTEEEKQNIEKIFVDDNSEFYKSLKEKGIKSIDGMTKILLIDSNVGMATIITFIAIYLGVVFLIASSAILALKQLTESSDNKQRYSILRKIGCDEKMINKSLFIHIGIFFIMPLILAIIHSIFGIKFALMVLSEIASSKELLPSIIVTIFVIGFIYGSYFLATYFGSKNVIKEE